MTLIKSILLAVGMSLSVFTVLAQNEADVLRYSFQEHVGTARYAGMGGAFSAIGGDLSSISNNPAGIAVYRRGDFGLTTAVSANQTSSLYQNNRENATDNRFHLPNIGVVGVYESNAPGWEFVNVGVAYNKFRNFGQRVSIEGDEMNTSLLNVFLNQANGVNFDELSDDFPFGAGLAWNTFLLDTLNSANPDQFISAIPGGQVTQNMNIETNGHFGETALTLGANYKNELYIGATIGFATLRYQRTMRYTESNLDPTLPLSSFTMTDVLDVSGNGVNIKLGVIYRASEWLRVSAAWHSPTALSLSDTWETAIISDFKTDGNYEDIALGGYDYNIRTAGRYIVGAAFILGKRGIVSADYEFIDYGRGKLSASNLINDGYDFSVENAAVRNVLRATHNVRIGAEWRLLPKLRIRGGYGLQQNPYADGATTFSSDALTYSGGIGYRGKKFYAEAAYQQRNVIDEYYLYDPSVISAAQLDQQKGEFIFTFGLRY